MLTKSFYTGFLAIFVVFSTLLTTLAYKVYQSEKVRPMIYSCFLYQGDYEQLKSRLDIESKYIDRFVIVQGIQNERVLEDQRQTLLKAYPEKIIYITTTAFGNGKLEEITDQFLNDQYLKGLEGCGNQDVVLFSSAEQIVDFKTLYGSLDHISKHPKAMHALENEAMHLSDPKIRATTYKMLRKKPSALVESCLDIKRKMTKKRRFFFQTQHRI